jgi:DNA-binding beta-propeller fold protein YncE
LCLFVGLAVILDLRLLGVTLRRTPVSEVVSQLVPWENYVSVINPSERREIRRIETANGPGMMLFRPDGKYAFVPSSLTPELDVIDRQPTR